MNVQDIIAHADNIRLYTVQLNTHRYSTQILHCTHRYCTGALQLGSKRDLNWVIFDTYLDCVSTFRGVSLFKPSPWLPGESPTLLAV